MGMKSMTHGSGNGSEILYVVEARMNYPEPKEYNGMILDREWRQVQFPKAPLGVPNSAFDPHARQIGLLGYDTAMALAHWFMAAPLLGSLCVETRLVKVKYSFTFDTEEIGVGPVMEVYETRRHTKFEPRAEKKEAVKP